MKSTSALGPMAKLGVADPEAVTISHQSIIFYLPKQNLDTLVNASTMEKALGEMQTLHACCSKVEPKIFAPLQTPFPGAQDGQNIISWRWSLPLPTNPVW